VNLAPVWLLSNAYGVKQWQFKINTKTKCFKGFWHHANVGLMRKKNLWLNCSTHDVRQHWIVSMRSSCNRCFCPALQQINIAKTIIIAHCSISVTASGKNLMWIWGGLHSSPSQALLSSFHPFPSFPPLGRRFPWEAARRYRTGANRELGQLF